MHFSNGNSIMPSKKVSTSILHYAVNNYRLIMGRLKVNYLFPIFHHGQKWIQKINRIWGQQTFLNLSLYYLLIAVFFKGGLITFHFSKNMFSFSNYISEWASILKMWFFFSKGVSIFKMWFFFERCFHFQNVALFRKVFSFSKLKCFVSFFFFFSEKHNCKQKF